MTSKGRCKSQEWNEFVECGDEKPIKQKCIHCEVKVSSKIERLREHLKKCKKFLKQVENSSDEEMSVLNISLFSLSQVCGDTETEDASSIPAEKREDNVSISSEEFSGATQPKKFCATKLDSFLMKTTAAEKKKIDLQFAKFFYACNIPFSVAENEHMKKLVQLMRGNSYTPPTRHDISTCLLDEVYEECETQLISELKGQNVTMIQDGWSNVHNHPVIATCLHNGNKAYFMRTNDPGSAKKKTTEYCTSLAEKEIDYCEKKYECKVIAFCSDNENKMVLTRKNLEKRFEERKSENLRDQNLIVYGCAAHYLNLVENDVSPRIILKQIVEVQRYFRNHHQPSGWLTEKNGVKPQLPNSTRWNSQNDCIDSFLKNYQIMHQICIEHRGEIEKEVIQIMNNAGLYMETVHLQQQLRLVSSALDNFQKDNCCLGEVVHIWHTLLEADALLPYKDAIQKRYNQCITPAHMVAYLAHPKYKGVKLTSAEEELALEWLKNIDENYVIPLMALQISDNDYYPKSMLLTNVTDVLAPSKWWKIMAKKAEKATVPISQEFCNYMAVLNSLPASLASVERLFSTFGFVQNKVRNRLGNNKTEKLVKCHQLLKSKCEEDW